MWHNFTTVVAFSYVYPKHSFKLCSTLLTVPVFNKQFSKPINHYTCQSKGGWYQEAVRASSSVGFGSGLMRITFLPQCSLTLQAGPRSSVSPKSASLFCPTSLGHLGDHSSEHPVLGTHQVLSRYCSSPSLFLNRLVQEFNFMFLF